MVYVLAPVWLLANLLPNYLRSQFPYLQIQQILSTYYVSGTVVGDTETVINKKIPNYDNWDCRTSESLKSLLKQNIVKASILDVLSNKKVLIK